MVVVGGPVAVIKADCLLPEIQFFWDKTQESASHCCSLISDARPSLGIIGLVYLTLFANVALAPLIVFYRSIWLLVNHKMPPNTLKDKSSCIYGDYMDCAVWNNKPHVPVFLGNKSSLQGVKKVGGYNGQL